MADGEEIVDLMAVMPARVRMADGRVVEPPGDRAIDAGEGAFTFEAEISSTALDAYFTHMADSTLRNFARDAATGVALLDSHDGYKLGVGYSTGGRYEEEDSEGRVVVSFYIVPGLRFGGSHSFASSDDYIRAIRSGVVRDVSVGFHGGRWICDLCGQHYFGQGSACNHVAGWEYEIERDGRMTREVCTVAIHDARLSEVSLVYDGATPGAMILKAEQEAAAGRLSPAMTRQLERQYRVRLPRAVATTVLGGGSADWTIQIGDGRAVTGGQPAERGQGVTMNKRDNDEVEVTPVEPQQPAEDAPEAEAPVVDEEARAMLEAIRQVTTRSAAPQGITLDAAVRWLNDQLVEVAGQRDAAQAEIARLQPLADQGRAYREELINQAVAEGVRAMGEAFPEETYRAMLVNAPLEHVRQVRDTFAAQAAERFPGGRQTRDAQREEKTERPDVPAAAYGAVAARKQ